MSEDVTVRHLRVALHRIAAIVVVVSLLVVVSGFPNSSSAQAPGQQKPLVPQTQLDGETCVPKFAVRLPVFGPDGSVPRVDAASHRDLTVTMKEIDQAVLPQYLSPSCDIRFRKTRVWAYETTDTITNEMLGPANWPAVSIVARRGRPTRVRYVNRLPSFNPNNPLGPGLLQGLLPFDQSLHWADPLHGMGHDMARDATASTAAQSDAPSLPPQYIGPVPATVHLHGGEIPAAFDGNPESWFTPDGLKGSDYHSVGNPSPGKAIYEYPNSQEAGTLWIHDHTLGTTRLNVYAGLAGFYFIKDPGKEPTGYPSGAQEIELAIQDRLFDTNSQLYMPQQIEVTDHPFWSVLFEGDVATVNGAAFPYLDVEPRRYRFHLLNGSNHRGYNFFLGSSTLPIYVIGADDNYFDAPVAVSSVPLSPGERTDIIVDFSNFAGQNLIVTNTAGGMKYPLKQIMQFRVAYHPKTRETSCDPANPMPSVGRCARKQPYVHLTDGQGHVSPGVQIDKVRQLTFYDFVVPDPNGQNPLTVKEYANSTVWNGLESPSIAHEFPDDGVSERPRVGSVELWEIAFLSKMPMAAHPFHIHLTQFQILNRQQMRNVGDYIAEWEGSFGQFGNVLLSSQCSTGAFCPDYGPPLPYSTLNEDGAVGGNPAFGSQFRNCTDEEPCPVTAPLPGEQGWKDTADVSGGEVLRILVRWTPSDVPLIASHSYAGENFYGSIRRRDTTFGTVMS